MRVSLGLQVQLAARLTLPPQIARLLGKFAERHRPAVCRGRDDPLRGDTFRHPIMERLERVEAVRRLRTSASAMARPSQPKLNGVFNILRDSRCTDWYIPLVHFTRGAAMQSRVARWSR